MMVREVAAGSRRAQQKTRAAGAGGRNFAYPISPNYMNRVTESSFYS